MPLMADFAAVRRDSVQGAASIGCEDNHVRGAPRATPAGGRIGERVCPSAGGRNRLQFVPGEKSYTPAVRRPERQTAVVGVFQPSRGQRIERAHPQLGIRAGDDANDERYHRPVRRQRDGTRVRIQALAARWQDRQSGYAGRGCAARRCPRSVGDHRRDDGGRKSRPESGDHARSPGGCDER